MTSKYRSKIAEPNPAVKKDSMCNPDIRLHKINFSPLFYIIDKGPYLGSGG